MEHLGDGLYRLTPRTGRTHQLRVHMASLGLPIIGDPLYPNVIDVAPDDFSRPLQLLAHSLEFDDPPRGSAVRSSAANRSLSRPRGNDRTISPRHHREVELHDLPVIGHVAVDLVLDIRRLGVDGA